MVGFAQMMTRVKDVIRAAIALKYGWCRTRKKPRPYSLSVSCRMSYR